MAQITTYSKPPETEADRIAAAERAKERGHTTDAGRREALLATGKGLLDEAAIELALEAERNIVPPDPEIAAAAARKERAQRKKDEARFAELVSEWKKNRNRQYAGLEMMFGAVFADMELSTEAAQLSAKLGMNNPLERGTMMHIADSTGIPQDKMHLVTRICDKIVKRYKESKAFDRSYFEEGV